MASIKRRAEDFDARILLIETLAIEEKALVLDEGTGEIRSASDSQAGRNLYARAFKEWAEGKLTGTAEDIFETVATVLDD